MEPLLNEGCAVKVEPVESGDLKIGDLVVFLKDSQSVFGCHRIVGKIKQNGKINYLEKGDNNNYIGTVSEDEIIGKAMYIIEDGKINSLEPHFVVNRFFLYLLTRIIVCHNSFAKIAKVILFSRRENKSAIFLNQALQRFYCLLLNLFLKSSK